MSICMLNKISKFAKENNISIEGLNYKFSDAFPESFYQTIINYLKSASHGYENNLKLENFFIRFDKNKNAFFEFLGTNNKTRVIVIRDDIEYYNLPPAKIIKENIFFENIKNLDYAKNNILLSSLPTYFIRRFIKDLNEVEPIDNFFEELTQKILYYINYLENEKKLLEENEKLYFLEAEASHNMPKSSSPHIRISTSRKNKEIPIDVRNETLDSYQPNDQFEAIASNSSSKYFVKVFKVNKKCKLVMEPHEGNKYTKIVHLNTDELSKVEIKEIVIDSLQLSRNEITQKENITRHSHTTLEEYKKLLEYLINEHNKGLPNNTKKKIDEASETKQR